MVDSVLETFSKHSELLVYLSISSIIFLIISALFIPILIAKIPADYFVARKKRVIPNKFTIRKVILLIIKNIIGIFLLTSGVLMLVLPGQGLLTILAAIFFLDFPGKYKLEQYLIKKPAVLQTINWIRRRKNVPDLLIS